MNGRSEAEARPDEWLEKENGASRDPLTRMAIRVLCTTIYDPRSILRRAQRLDLVFASQQTLKELKIGC